MAPYLLELVFNQKHNLWPVACHWVQPTRLSISSELTVCRLHYEWHCIHHSTFLWHNGRKKLQRCSVTASVWKTACEFGWEMPTLY